MASMGIGSFGGANMGLSPRELGFPLLEDRAHTFFGVLCGEAVCLQRRLLECGFANLPAKPSANRGLHLSDGLRSGSRDRAGELHGRRENLIGLFSVRHEPDAKRCTGCHTFISGR